MFVTVPIAWKGELVTVVLDKFNKVIPHNIYRALGDNISLILKKVV
tara:strand:+ start:10823 stop:10960 length:138 start_codon:yes stop_codon:yes gene_type:complete